MIYMSHPGKYDPPLGEYLGEPTDEMETGDHIVEFVTGGLKNYTYKTNTKKLARLINPFLIFMSFFKISMS